MPGRKDAGPIQEKYPVQVLGEHTAIHIGNSAVFGNLLFPVPSHALTAQKDRQPSQQSRYYYHSHHSNLLC